MTCFTDHMGARCWQQFSYELAPTCSMILAIKLSLYDCIFKPCTNSIPADPEFQLVADPESHVWYISIMFRTVIDFPKLCPAGFPSLSLGYPIYFQTGCTMTVHDVLRYLSAGNEIQKGRQWGENEIDRVQKSLLGTTCNCWHWCYSC